MTLDSITIKDNKIFDQEGNYRGEILYRYIRGSQLYHTNISTSDIDEGGIYIMPDETLKGLGFDYQDEIKNKSNDKCIWEIGRFLHLVLTGNPTVLEALFIPDDMVLYEHPIIRELRTHRNEFVTKNCFNPFAGYAVSQIKKAQGQNKKIHWDITNMTRKSPLDFVYTFSKQGSKNIQPWLEERGLEQRHIGLVNIPNMKSIYGAYYDFGQHIKFNDIKKEDFCNISKYESNKFFNFCYHYLGNDWDKENLNYNDVMSNIWDEHSKPIGHYCGIISPNSDSNEIRSSSHVEFSSVKKGESPICWVAYNEDGYHSHCRKYKEYEDWKKNRNKARYENNLEGEKSCNPDMKYDSKNMMHCFRLMAMAKEIAEGKGIILDRTGIDRDFLLDVRNRKYGYSELNEKMLKLKEDMDEAIKSSTIKDDIDKKYVNSILLDIRNKWNKLC